MSQQPHQELTAAIAADYEATPKPTLQALSKKYNLHPLTVRKHLVTAGVYDTPKTNLVLSALCAVFEQSVTSDEIVAEVEKYLAERNVVMSKQTIYSYLPYDITASGTDAAERKRLQREREAAVGRIVDFDSLWQAIILFEGYPFYTAKGLLFRYKVKSGELFVNRKEKSITESSVRICYEKAVKMNGIVPGPKKLGVFGASYLYPVFIRFGVIRQGMGQNRKKLSSSKGKISSE